MGELIRSFSSRHHPACKASRAARVGIRENSDQLVGKRCRIEGLPIVDNKHVEVVVNWTVLVRYARFNELDIRENVLFILKCGGRKSKIDRVN